MSEIQKRAFTESSSLHQLMAIVFSEILRQRKYYEDRDFFQHQVSGLTVSLLDWLSPFVDSDISKSIAGAATAVDLQYVLNVQMLFKIQDDGPECFVERYALCFDEENVPELVSPNRRATLSKSSDQCWSKEAILRMLESVQKICSNLGEMPRRIAKTRGIRVSFRLNYNDKCPKGYQAPYFSRSNFTAMYFSNHLPSPTAPQPKRVVSSTESTVYSTLCAESMMSGRSSASPPPAKARFPRRFYAREINSDTSTGSPFLPPTTKREAASLPREDPEQAKSGDEDDREEVETVRGDDNDVGRKRRSIIDEEGLRKKRRSTSSMSDGTLNSLDGDYCTSGQDSSMLVADATMIRRSLSESPQMTPKAAKKKEEKEDHEEEEEETEEDEQGTDRDESVDSDGGEPFFIN